MPNCVQVVIYVPIMSESLDTESWKYRTSATSSNVPYPPGRAMNPRQISAIIFLRSCIDPTGLCTLRCSASAASGATGRYRGSGVFFSEVRNWRVHWREHTGKRIRETNALRWG